jgi:hypothetical protein
MLNVKKLLTLKANFILKYIETFSAHNLSTLLPVFINGNCEKLSTRKVNFRYNILAIFLSPKLSTICPLFINVRCKKHMNFKNRTILLRAFFKFAVSYVVSERCVCFSNPKSTLGCPGYTGLGFEVWRIC